MQKRKKYDDYARPENLVNINERRKVVKQKSKNVTIIPRNTKQEEYIDMLFNYNKKLIFAVGPAGTGKTMLAVQFAIKEMLDGNIDKILITRPAVTADEDHGFLPGTLMEKMAPWTRPIFDVFAEYYTAGEIEEMIRENVVEVCPVAYARGRTFKNALVIVDEAQNLTIEQTKMIVTRLGDNARMVVNGDINQCDLQLKDGKQNGLADILAKTKSGNSKMIGAVVFNKQHIERSDIVAEIVGLYGDE